MTAGYLTFQKLYEKALTPPFSKSPDDNDKKYLRTKHCRASGKFILEAGSDFLHPGCWVDNIPQRIKVLNLN
jgi:hypothetical protein